MERGRRGDIFNFRLDIFRDASPKISLKNYINQFNKKILVNGFLGIFGYVQLNLLLKFLGCISELIFDKNRVIF